MVIICFLQLKRILLCFFKLFDGETDNIIINISVIWFGKKMRENNLHNSDPETS